LEHELKIQPILLTRHLS